MDVSFIVDGDLLEKYNTVEDKVSANIKKEFDSEPVYDKNYLKTKIKCRGNDVTDFYDKKIAELDSNHTCSVVTTLDFAITKDENYYCFKSWEKSQLKRKLPTQKKIANLEEKYWGKKK